MSVPAQTTLATLKDQSAPVKTQDLPVVRSGFDTLQAFDLMQRQAKLLMASSLIPEAFRGNLPNVTIALEMAARIGASPLMVMQNLDVIYGRPSWRSQFAIACFNTCGRFSAIRYRFTGTEGKDDWSCKAFSTERETGEVISGPTISIALAKKEGWYDRKDSKWKTSPELMLMYRAGSWLQRTHAPEITMGMQTSEEVRDAFDATKGPDGRFTVDLNALREADPSNNLSPVSYDIAAAKASIAGAKTIEQLRNAWDQIVEQCSAAGIEVPIELDAAAKDREAALAQDE